MVIPVKCGHVHSPLAWIRPYEFSMRMRTHLCPKEWSIITHFDLLIYTHIHIYIVDIPKEELEDSSQA